jgi:hypothetical protein
VTLADGPVRALLCSESDPYTVVARDPTASVEDEEQLADDRLMLTDRLAWPDMEAGDPSLAMRIRQWRQNEAATEPGHAMAVVTSEREESHQVSLARSDIRRNGGGTLLVPATIEIAPARASGTVAQQRTVAMSAPHEVRAVEHCAGRRLRLGFAGGRRRKTGAARPSPHLSRSSEPRR